MNFSPLSSPCLTQVSPTNFSQHWPPPIWLAPRPAHCVQVPESPATSSHLSRAGALSPELFPGLGGGIGQQARQATPRGGGPHLRGRGPPSALHRGSGRNATHLLGVAGRCSAPGPRGGGRLLARLGHGEAATSAASGRAQRRLEGRPGRGSLEGRKEGSGGGNGRAREAAFPTQPRARSGAAPRPAGPSPSCPLLAVAGPGLKLNTLGPVSSPSDPPRPTPGLFGSLWVRERRGWRSPGSSSDLPRRILQLCSGRAGTRAWPVYVPPPFP